MCQVFVAVFVYCFHFTKFCQSSAVKSLRLNLVVADTNSQALIDEEEKQDNMEIFPLKE